MTKQREYKRLHAEWYDLVSNQNDHEPEIEFWERCIQEAGEPVLELGSGTGRVLIPLLDRGYRIVGVDTSTSMLARCAAECDRRALTADIHMQSMLELMLDRQFALIILTSGGLGLFTSDDDIGQLFDSVSRHLRPGGAFIYEYEPVPAEGDGPRRFSNGEVNGTDGSTLRWEIQRRYDNSTHVWESTFSLERVVNGATVEREVNDRTGRYFTEDEAIQFALDAGLEDVVASDWLARGPITAQSKVVTVRCSKPAEEMGSGPISSGRSGPANATQSS